MLKDTEWLGKANFTWWYGIVEDVLDPLLAGRARVRIFGWHSQDKGKLPKVNLPWAQQIQDISSAAHGNVGKSPTGLLEGSWVMGFFLDGENAQFPIIMGSFAGIPESSDTPDVSALARADPSDLPKNPTTKDGKRTEQVPIYGIGQAWDEPKSAWAAEYPKNHVKESERGHIFEMDDTPGKERIHEYHRAGTFYEIDSKGNKSTRIVGDNYEVIAGDGHINVKGDVKITVDNNAHIYVKKKAYIRAENLDLKVDKDMTWSIGGNWKATIGKSASIDVGRGYSVGVGGISGMLSSIGIPASLAGPLSAALSLSPLGALTNPLGAITSGIAAIGTLKNGLAGVTDLTSGLLDPLKTALPTLSPDTLLATLSNPLGVTELFNNANISLDNAVSQLTSLSPENILVSAGINQDAILGSVGLDTGTINKLGLSVSDVTKQIIQAPGLINNLPDLGNLSTVSDSMLEVQNTLISSATGAIGFASNIPGTLGSLSGSLSTVTNVFSSVPGMPSLQSIGDVLGTGYNIDVKGLATETFLGARKSTTVGIDSIVSKGIMFRIGYPFVVIN